MVDSGSVQFEIWLGTSRSNSTVDREKRATNYSLTPLSTDGGHDRKWTAISVDLASHVLELIQLFVFCLFCSFFYL